MVYSDKQKELSLVFNPDLSETALPGSGIRIVNTSFVSDSIPCDFFSGNDYSISENSAFSYPVFVPADRESKKTIILLHGLNERSWNKYLSWAYYLSEMTGSYIILFPISFHINRSPLSWKDPRSMLQYLKEKTVLRGEVRNSSFANVALSNRLSDDPRRFMKSGYQTVHDLIKLMKQINKGLHPVIPGGSTVNLFAYSIGAFLAEIIMMANPEKLFSGSKLFMFCGGSVFSNMRGESKLIMDKLAYEKVYCYYMEKFETEIVEQRSVFDHLISGRIVMAFRSMIDLSRFGDFREKALNSLEDRIYSIGLSRDTVIPAAGIEKTLNKHSRVEVIDFKHNYTHENPFPVLNNSGSAEVDRSFEKIFVPAGRFLS